MTDDDNDDHYGNVINDDDVDDDDENDNDGNGENEYHVPCKERLQGPWI